MNSPFGCKRKFPTRSISRGEDRRHFDVRYRNRQPSRSGLEMFIARNDMVEKGVRFVQLYNGTLGSSHDYNRAGARQLGASVDHRSRP